MYMFGDSFDTYQNVADLNSSGFWEFSSGGTISLVTTARFPPGQSITVGSGTGDWLVKTSSQNDNVHHVNFAFFPGGSAPSGTTPGLFVTLRDGTTSQVSFYLRSDGAMIILRGAYNGTVIGTYTGAWTVASQWNTYEVEVVVHPTAGSVTVRKNGNIVNDFTLTGQNTAPSGNAYANRLAIGAAGSYGSPICCIDDIFWRSDPSAVPWVGDIRSYIRRPSADALAQFSRNLPGNAQQTLLTNFTTLGSGFSEYTPFTPAYNCKLLSYAFTMTANFTGNVKVALFDTNVSNNPGNVLASGSIVNNPTTGAAGTFVNTSTFASQPTLVAGTQYFIGVMPDSSSASFQAGSGTTTGRYTNSTTNPSYANFPQSGVVGYTNTNGVYSQLTFATQDNASMTRETPHDAAASYVYDNVVGHNDLYSLAPIAASPLSVLAVTTRGVVQKSDAGSRLGAIQMKSGSTIVQTSVNTVLNTYWAHTYRIDATNPATGAAWLPTDVNNLQIGPILTA